MIAVVAVVNGGKFTLWAFVHPSDSECITLGEVVSVPNLAVVDIRDLRGETGLIVDGPYRMLVGIVHDRVNVVRCKVSDVVGGFLCKLTFPAIHDVLKVHSDVVVAIWSFLCMNEPCSMEKFVDHDASKCATLGFQR